MLDTSYRYNYSEAKSDRIKYKIPKIEEKMRLKERKIEYEKWINKDLYQQNISHHLKEINIGTHSINKETDYFINPIENKVLIIENKLPTLFHNKVIKSFFIGTHIEFYPYQKLKNKKQISLKQSDSILEKWGFNLDSIYPKENCEN